MARKINSLYWKISGIFLVLLLVLGAVQLQLSLRSSVDFALEAEQRLNRHLARDLAKRFAPFLADSLDREAIGHNFHDLMVMNPRLEIYLLDKGGKLLAYFADSDKIKRLRVDPEPIRRFIGIDSETPLPILGDDPRSLYLQKPFSATPVLIAGKEQGYLYIILEGEDYASIASMSESSYIVKTSGFILGGVLLLTGTAGLILFFLLTKRLRGMTAVVRGLESGDYRQRIEVGPSDELGQLGSAFNQMADKLVANMEEIKRNDALRRDLIANVSHDLRTPLANIQGYLETVLIKEGELEAQERRHYLDVIFHNVTMLGRLISQLFELSKLEAKQVELRNESFSLAELVQDTALDFQSQAAKRGVELATNLNPGVPFVYGDIGMIERVLANLIENALNFTQSGGQVKLELEVENRGVKAIVADTGQGIPERDLPYIFDRFYRGDKRRAEGGTGLGLAIAQKIVQAHGSEITVDSQEGKGSVFSFILPKQV